MKAKNTTGKIYVSHLSPYLGGGFVTRGSSKFCYVCSRAKRL